MSELSATSDVALKNAGNEALGAVGRIASSYALSGTAATEVAKNRADLEAGTLSNLHSAGIGSKADHSA